MEKEKTEYYAYEILLRLASLWLTLRKNITLPEQRKESAVHLRMKKILQYIEEHYGEDITLEDMAASASISKTECARCFKTSLNTTPTSTSPNSASPKPQGASRRPTTP